MKDVLEPSGTRTTTTQGVRLSVPPSFSNVRIARLTAAAVASSLPLDIDAIDDVLIAIDELSSALIEAGPLRDIDYTFTRSQGVFVACGTTTVTNHPQLNDLARGILDVAVDDFELSESNGRGHFRATKRSWC
jgi:hypothetical protein